MNRFANEILNDDHPACQQMKQEFVRTCQEARNVEEALENLGIKSCNSRMAIIGCNYVKNLPKERVRELAASGQLLLPEGYMETNQWQKILKDTKERIIKVSNDISENTAKLYSRKRVLAQATGHAKSQLIFEIKNCEMTLERLCLERGGLMAHNLNIMLLVPLDVFEYYGKVSKLLEVLNQIYVERAYVLLQYSRFNPPPPPVAQAQPLAQVLLQPLHLTDEPSGPQAPPVPVEGP
jgi:hypothetical protein